MPQYVALIRGVTATNPNLRNEKLRAVFEDLGLKNVRAVLASGNLVFESPARSTAALEKRIEQAMQSELGVITDVLVRSQEELEALIKSDPFDGAEHGKQWYLTVTFRKHNPKPVCLKHDRATLNGPDMMAGFERKFTKHITTRTWATILRIIAKMDAA